MVNKKLKLALNIVFLTLGVFVFSQSEKDARDTSTYKSNSLLNAQDNYTIPKTIDDVLQKVFNITLQEYRDSFYTVKSNIKIDSTKGMFVDPLKKEFHTDILIKKINEDLLSSIYLRSLSDEEIKNYKVASYAWLSPVSREDMKSILQKNGDTLTEQEWFTLKKRLTMRNRSIDGNDPPTLLLEIAEKK